MPEWVVRKMLKNINKKNPKILLLGFHIRKMLMTIGNPLHFTIMKILEEKKIMFDYNDPYFSNLRQVTVKAKKKIYNIK